MTTEKFVFLPSSTGDGVVVKREQIVGARPNGPNGGSVLYTKAGPSIYTSLTTEHLAALVAAEKIQQP